MIAEGRAAELEALNPVYAVFRDVTVEAHLDQWWAVRVSGYSVRGDRSRQVQVVSEGYSFLQALRSAAAKAVDMASPASAAQPTP